MDQNNRRNTLLIVDDDEINREILKNLFSDSYNIKEAENGCTGLQEILDNQDQLCAVLLDVIMPKMDGIEVLRRLRHENLLEQIPVFLITAEPGANMKEAYQLGVMDVISKPVIPYMVLRRVHSIVELFQMRQKLEIRVEEQQNELLENAKKIISLNEGMIEALSAAIEFRSVESGEHVQRIRSITRTILTKSEFGKGLSHEEIDNISLAAVMHDVGKIAISDSILNKPGKLTLEEYEIMKTHTIQGAALLEKIPQLHEHSTYHYAFDIALHHHERWDGHGYPDGLKGDEISPWAQVVSLADVYDALSCKRVYKDAFPRETVLEMIRTGQCGVFNPYLLECFFSVEGQLATLYEGGK